MPRYLLIVLLIFAACLQTQAQQVELMFSAGMASYSMRDLKKLNSSLQSQVPFETKVTDNFPMTLQLGGQFAVQLTKLYKMGIKYAYNSTGSRIAASDYSGSYRFDNVLSGHTIGMINSFLLFDHKAFRVDIQTNIGLVASILKMNEDLHVADTSISTSTHYSSVGLFFEPLTEATYQWKYFKAGIFIGYFINPGGRITNEKGQKTTSTTNWSGFRFGIVIGIHQINR
jgi:hypothetical protein